MSETITTPLDTSVNSPGAVLKRCREYHDITLEEASQTTKIGIYYLKSLEEDRISGFANLTYLKGFLRIYSVYLGLNPDDMARMYDKLYGVKDGKSNAENSPASCARPARRMVPLKKLALPAFLLLLILITATFFKKQPSPAIRMTKPVAIPSEALPVSAVQPILTSSKIRRAPPVIEESKTPLTNIADKAPQSIKPADHGKGFVLKIKVIRNGNLNAVVDDSAAQAYELTVGDVIEWKAEKSVALDLSDAGGIDVELNGKHFKQLGPRGKSAYVLFDADGIKP